MTRLDDDPSSNVGKASNSLTSDVEQGSPRQAPEPASAVFQGRILQVLEKAFLHFGYDLQDDWVQSLRKIQIKTRECSGRPKFFGAFEPIINRAIEAARFRGEPIYATLGGYPQRKEEHLKRCHRYFFISTARMTGMEVSFSWIQCLMGRGGNPYPEILLHKYASIFDKWDNQNYWTFILVVTKGLLSDETIREPRKKESLSQNIRLLLDVNSKWNAKERAEIFQHECNNKTPNGNDDGKIHGVSATSLFEQSRDSGKQRNSERKSPASPSLSNKVRESVASMKSLTPLPRRPYSPSLPIHP